METKRLIMFRVLLNRFHPTTGDQFLKIVPREHVKEILNQKTLSQEVGTSLAQPIDFIQKIHFSWLISPIQKLPVELHSVVASSLPDPLSASISKYLKITPHEYSVSPPISSYLLKLLFDEIFPKEILPPDYLLPSPLTPLLQLNKSELTELIDFLGIFDLTEETRRIVQKQQLRDLYKCLGAKKVQFLRHCLNQKVKFTTPKLDLDKTKIDPKKLEDIIHRRGMARLGMALSGQQKDLIWHICHALDTGRAAIIQKHAAEEVKPSIAQLLSQQVISTLNFLKSKSSP